MEALDPVHRFSNEFRKKVMSSLAKKFGEHLHASRYVAVLFWTFLEATSPSTSSSLCARDRRWNCEMSTGPLANMFDTFGAFIGSGAPLDVGKYLKDVSFRAVVFMEVAVHLGQHLCFCIRQRESINTHLPMPTGSKTPSPYDYNSREYVQGIKQIAQDGRVHMQVLCVSAVHVEAETAAW